MKRILWLRHETKPFEQRVALTPAACERLLSLGHELIVEESANRCFSIEDYRSVGCQIRPTNSWITNAPNEAIIIGLKELEEQEFPLIHRHIHFAHAYKGQTGAKELLERFTKGGGLHYDLEYLVDADERRIAAFGVWAGFTGAAIGLMAWAAKKRGEDFNKQAPLSPFNNEENLIQSVKLSLNGLEAPRVLIIGHKGRCGRGASKLLNSLGLKFTGWGSSDTKGQGPFPSILDFDLLINTVFMKGMVNPFLTRDLLHSEQSLKVISDVSCDPTGPFNPLPLYDQITTMDLPIRLICDKSQLEITAIDHLPSLLPTESSDDFCQQLLPYLEKFLDGDIESTPWERSLQTFYKNLIHYNLIQNEGDLGTPISLD